MSRLRLRADLQYAITDRPASAKRYARVSSPIRLHTRCTPIELMAAVRCISRRHERRWSAGALDTCAIGFSGREAT